MPSYDSFMCPNCEHYFRVIWPDPMPSYHDCCSKIKCPDYGEVTEHGSYQRTIQKTRRNDSTPELEKKVGY